MLFRSVLNSFHSFFFILLCGSYFHYFIFQVPYLFFCLRYSAIDSSREFLILFLVLFIIDCLLFRFLLNVSCIFSILFPDFGSSLVSLLSILFQVVCLFPPHFFGQVSFYLALSSAAYFSVFSLCLTYCVWGLLLTGCRFIVFIVSGVCPQWVRLVQWVV